MIEYWGRHAVRVGWGVKIWQILGECGDLKDSRYSVPHWKLAGKHFMLIIVYSKSVYCIK